MHLLVVGAGIAGPTLTHWLARAGHRVTLVEHAPRPRQGGYLIDFWGAGFDVAEQMGLVPELRRRGYVLHGAATVDGNGHRFATLRTDRLVSAQRYVSIARSELAAAILRSLEPFAPAITVRWGDSVAAVRDTGDEVVAELTSGERCHVDLVVGADGLHSAVRRLAFGPAEDYVRPLGAAVAAFELSGYRPRDETLALMHADVGFQVVRASLRDDTTVFMITFRHTGPLPTTDRAAIEALVRTTLAGAGWEVPQMLRRLDEPAEIYLDAVAQVRMPTWHRGRIALVGDAASCPSLLAGQGSALAMVQAYTLAAELARTPDHTTAFAAYEQRLAALLRAKQAGATRLLTGFAPANRRQLWLRNLTLRAAGLPGVANLASGPALRDRVTLPPFPPQPEPHP